MQFISVLGSFYVRPDKPRWPVIASLAILVTALTAVAPAQKPQAILPQVFIDTTWNPPVGGTTWAAHTSTQLKSALTSSVPGDVIVLDAGVTYSGNFTLPAKVNNGKWIYIISSALASMPEGTQVSPADVGNMPKIVTPNTTSVWLMQSGANHWRLAGLELTTSSAYPAGCSYSGTHCFSYNLMAAVAKPVVTPTEITIDRCYIHGTPTIDLQQGVQLNANYGAIIDSYVDDIHMKVFDSVGVLAYWTPGPLKIVNNYVAASTENIMFGGAGGWNNPYVPSDIEIRNNYLFKPLSWVDLSVNQKQMRIKNAFEIKSAQRVLFDSNTIENVWANAQTGFAILLSVRSSQSGDIAVVNDITITNNVLKNVVSFVTTLGADDQCGKATYPNCHNAGSTDRWNIRNNLVTFYDPKALGGARNTGLIINAGTDRINGGIHPPLKGVLFQHNTLIPNVSTPCWEAIYFSTPGQTPPLKPVAVNMWVLDNVLCRQPTGDWGLQGTYGLTQYMGDPNTPPYDLTQRFYGNVMYVPPGDKVQSFPPHNYATTVAFTYVDPASFDYQLLTPYWTDTTDGNIAGVQNADLP